MTKAEIKQLLHSGIVTLKDELKDTWDKYEKADTQELFGRAKGLSYSIGVINAIIDIIEGRNQC